MTLQSFNGGFYWPDPHAARLALPAIQTLQIDASGEKVGFVFVAPKTGNIDRVFARVVAKTTNGTLDVRLETVDAATGKPSGTLVATNTSGTFSNTVANETIDVTLTAVAPVTKGTQYALVINQNAGNCTIAIVGDGAANIAGGGIASRLAYSLHNTGGAWSALNASPSTTGQRPNCGLRYDDLNYYFTLGVVCLSSIASTAFNNTSGTRERGTTLNFPFPARVTGWWFLGNIATNSNYDVILAQTDGTALLTFSGDKDQAYYYASGANYGGTMVGYFSSTADLLANTKYYLTLKPQGASNIWLTEFTLISGTSIAAQMGMFNGGTNAYLVTRDSGGTYTETTTQRPWGFGVIVSAFDDAVSAGGGLLRHPGMRGGLNA